MERGLRRTSARLSTSYSGDNPLQADEDFAKNWKQDHQLKDLPTFSHKLFVFQNCAGQLVPDKQKKAPQEKTPAARTAFCKERAFVLSR